MKTGPNLFQKASAFLQLLHEELELGNPDSRLNIISEEINRTGTYTHLPHELEHGARMAWRNSNRCIGRLYWKSLIVRDHRGIHNTEDAISALSAHLREATNQGKILPMISIFPQLLPTGLLR